MSDPPVVSLELLQATVQRVLDVVTLLREDNRSIRRRLSRIENELLALRQGQVDRDTAESSVQNQLDALIERVERLEADRS